MTPTTLTNRTVAWIGIAALTVASGLYLLAPLRRLSVHLPLLPNEGWNAQFSAIAFGGGPLYPASDTFLFNNYPPISFYVVGLLGQLLGDNILAGRLISLAAIAVIAVNVALTVRNLGGTRPFGLLAGVLFIGILAKTYIGYVGVNDPQLLAHAIMTTGFTVLTTSPRSMRNIAWAAFLMVLAGFTKHSIFAMPLAVTTWYLQNDRRSLAHWLTFSVGFLIVGFAAAALLYGLAFFQQLLYQRAYSLHNVLMLLGWLQTIIVPLVLWIVFARQAPADPKIRLITHLLIAGGIEFVVIRSGDNVGINPLLDWVIAASIAAGVATSRIDEIPLSRRYGPVITRGLIVGALCLRMFLMPQHELIDLLFRPDVWKQSQARDAAFRTEVALMRKLPGPALCENITLCYRAGHLSAYDSINGVGAFQLGVRDIAVLQRQIAAGQYRLVQLYPHSPLLDAARAAGLREEPGAQSDIIFHAAQP